jgi:hypothetical protein
MEIPISGDSVVIYSEMDSNENTILALSPMGTESIMNELCADQSLTEIKSENDRHHSLTMGNVNGLSTNMKKPLPYRSWRDLCN